MKKFFLLATLLLTAWGAQAQIDEAELLDLINQLRADGCQCGNKAIKPASELHWNADLADVAQEYADHLNENNNELVVGQHLYLSDVGIDGSTLTDRLQDGGVQVKYAIENIVCIRTDKVAMVLDQWLNSYESCLHIMDHRVTIMGAARSGDFWVLILAEHLPTKDNKKHK